MIFAKFIKYDLQFKEPSGTSRGILHQKATYFLKLIRGADFGIGECALFKGLSADDVPNYEQKLDWLCHNINSSQADLSCALNEFPSIQFGLEQAFLSLNNKVKFELFPSQFTKGKAGIPINGLIWMGSKEFMNQQIKEKLKAGFTTIKLKIGAIDFDAELALINAIRNEFSANEIEIRVDANGGFSPEEALEKLKRLSDFNLHSIEQPIKAKQWQKMAQLCAQTPLPIALDEELIGVFDEKNKERLLQTINPQFIILKPSLIGGIEGSKKWIDLAKKQNIAWWITSALESNIGLNAIAQFAFTLANNLPQGLGTGGLFTNNIKSPLEIKSGYLYYNTVQKWHFSNLIFN